MKIIASLILILLLKNVAVGQHVDDIVFKYKFNKHFRPIPKNLEIAITQLDSNFTEKGRYYFKELPENLAIIQFGEAYYMVLFSWKLHKANTNEFFNTMFNKEDKNALRAYFRSNGGGDDSETIIRVCVAALHRKLNNKTYSITELWNLYNSCRYNGLINSIRNFILGDTVIGSWFVEQSFFNRFSYEVLGKVISCDRDTLKMKVVEIHKSDVNINEIKTDHVSWKVGDVLTEKKSSWRNWKENIALYYKIE